MSGRAAAVLRPRSAVAERGKKALRLNDEDHVEQQWLGERSTLRRTLTLTMGKPGSSYCEKFCPLMSYIQVINPSRASDNLLPPQGADGDSKQRDFTFLLTTKRSASFIGQLCHHSPVPLDFENS